MSDISAILSKNLGEALTGLQSAKDAAAAEAVVEKEATDAVIEVASASNMLAGLAVKLAAPSIIHAIVNTLFDMFQHIGAAVPNDLKIMKDELDKITHGVL